MFELAVTERMLRCTFKLGRPLSIHFSAFFAPGMYPMPEKKQDRIPPTGLQVDKDQKTCGEGLAIWKRLLSGCTPRGKGGVATPVPLVLLSKALNTHAPHPVHYSLHGPPQRDKARGGGDLLPWQVHALCRGAGGDDDGVRVVLRVLHLERERTPVMAAGVLQK